MSDSWKGFLILFLGVSLSSCSRQKTISRDELRSDVLAAISLASETEVFIGQMQQDRVTRVFATGHTAYLSDEVMRSAKELSQENTDERIAGALENCRAQLDSMAALLADLKGKTGDRESLSADKQEAARIRMILERAKAEL